MQIKIVSIYALQYSEFPSKFRVFYQETDKMLAAEGKE